jgi:hypothetical protein
MLWYIPASQDVCYVAVAAATNTMSGRSSFIQLKKKSTKARAVL